MNNQKFKMSMIRYYENKASIILDIRLKHYKDALKKIMILQNKQDKSVLEENLCYRASAMIHFGIGNIDMAKKCINTAITLMVDKEGLEEYNMARLCNYAVYQDVYGEELTEEKRKRLEELIRENKNKNLKYFNPEGVEFDYE